MTTEFNVFARKIAKITQYNCLQIIHELQICDSRELSVGEIVDRIKLRQNLTSYHLGNLVKLGILEKRVNGKQRMYSISLNGWSDFMADIHKFI